MLTGLAAANLFKDYFGLEPGFVQVVTTFISIPWSFKLLYGIISDNLPISGERRKPYLLLFSTAQFMAMVILSLTSELNYAWSTFLLMVGSLSVAFNDVTTDSLMVVQARLYP